MSQVFYTNVARQKNDLLVRIADGNGGRKNMKVKFKPTLYLPTHNLNNVDKLGLAEEPLVAKKFESIWDAQQYLDEYKDVEGADVYGQTDWAFQFIAHSFPGKIKFSPSVIKVANLDIEILASGWDPVADKFLDGPFPHPTIEEKTFKSDFIREKYQRSIAASAEFIKRHMPESFIDPGIDLNAAFPINLVQVQNLTTEEYIVYGLPCSKDRGKYKYAADDEQIGGLKLVYHEFQTEQELLKKFLTDWREEGFDAWTGWNIEGFDSPYLVERIRKVLGDSWVDMLSVWGEVKKRTVRDKKGDYTSYDFVGTETLDYQAVYKKHTYTTRERYSLDWIAYVELGEKKLDYSESKSLFTLHFDDYEKFVRYGVKDVKLVSRLNQKLRLIELMFVLAYQTKSNYKDGLGTVAPWSAMCYYKLYEKGIVPKIRRLYTGPTDFEGAYVMEVKPGRYRWLFSMDLNSLYPHIIQQYNMGPETIVNDPHLRSLIIDGMCDEINEAIKVEVKMPRRNRLTMLRNKLIRAKDERCHVIDELVAVGKFKFQTLVDHNVSFTPNVQFFSNKKMSFQSEIMREIYSGRKVEKATGLRFEQYAAWCKEMLDKSFQVNSAKDSRFYDEEWYNGHKDLLDAHLKEAAEKWELAGIIQDVLQQGLKILMNAGYGAISNIYFKEYFDIRIAEGITTSGQLINKWNKRHTDRYLNNEFGTAGLDYVIAGDTDSNYITVERMVTRDWPEETDPHKLVANIDKWIKETYSPMVNQWCIDLCETVNGYEQRMVWEREVIASDAVWRAAKMYCMAVYDSEGVKYEKPKVKYKGLEARKSSTPEWARKRMEECYKTILLGTEDDLQKQIKGYRDEWASLAVEDIAKASSVSDVTKWEDGNSYKSGTPYNSKAAITWNKQVAQHPELGLTEIESGDKMLMVMLKPGNPLRETYLAFPTFLDPGLDLNKWVDYNEMLEKGFISPIQTILDCVGWSSKRRVNLMAKMMATKK